jgi:pseudouridine synthase
MTARNSHDKKPRRTGTDAPAGRDAEPPVGERLQKILARAGLGSRRACEELIVHGRVQVDGSLVTELGTRANPQHSRITVDGKPIRQERLTYYMVNKPRGYICTMEVGAEGHRITDLVPKHVRVFPVGRLEVESEGLMVLTNDGMLTQQLTHPSYGVSRVYVAEVEGADITEAATGRLQKGVHLAEGRTLPAEVRVVRRVKNGGTLEITIREGLNREIRRMLVAVGLKPRHIVRIRLGRLSLGDLPTGSYRVLEPEELDKVRKGLSRNQQQQAPAWIRRRKTRKGLPPMNAVPSSVIEAMGFEPHRKRRVVGGKDVSGPRRNDSRH